MAFQYTFRSFDIPSWELAARDLVDNRDLELELYIATIDSAVALKADIASPTFTGTPTLPTGTIAVTQTAGNNTTAVATTAFVDTAIGDWASFTVTTTGSSNMTFVGQKLVINKICFFEIIGTGAAGCVPPTQVTLPETMSSLNSAVGFQAAYLDHSATAWYYGPAQRSSGTVINTRVWNASATYLTGTALTSAIPFTWAVDDLFVLTGSFKMS